MVEIIHSLKSKSTTNLTLNTNSHIYGKVYSCLLLAYFLARTGAEYPKHALMILTWSRLALENKTRLSAKARWERAGPPLDSLMAYQ